MILVDIKVPGDPATKGSAKAIPFKRSDGSLGANVMNSNPRAKEWQHRIAYFAKQAMPVGVALDQAVHVQMDFFFERPEGHLRKTVGADGFRLLAKGAPYHHQSKPDVDKLERVVLDALTGICYHDDAQVTHSSAWKYWCQGRGSGVRVRVETSL